MPNTIKLKYGSGPPAGGQLASGEVGLDVTNKVIYTSTTGLDIIEMGRNMGEGGTIGWDQIDPDTIPNEINIIIDPNNPNYVDLTVLEGRVEINEGDIQALKDWETAARAEILALQSAVSQNASAISANGEAIGANATQIGKNVIAIAANLDAIGEHETRITYNKNEIDKLKDQIDKDLTGLVLAGTYSAATNLITTVKSTAVDPDGKVLFTEDTALNAYAGNAYAGFYFVVDAAGKLANTGTPARNDGDDAFIGDWMVSDGPHWLHFNFSQESTAWGTIGGVLSAQTDLQAALDKKLDGNSTLDGGTYA